MTDIEAREAKLRKEIESEGGGLIRRDDGFYNVTDEDGTPTSPYGWRVRTWDLNDRGGEVGSPYPLTLDEVEYWTSNRTAGRPPDRTGQ
jgi:hypothetical protein